MANHGDGGKDALGHSRKLNITSQKHLTWFIYMPNLSWLAGDASAYGVGAVILHVMPNGSEHPIAFASHTLPPNECNYSQVPLIFGVRKFHQYWYGRHFTIVTDHKPLTTILGSKQGIPAWQQLACSIGPCHCLLMRMTFSSGLQGHMGMQMVFHGCHYWKPPCSVLLMNLLCSM